MKDIIKKWLEKLGATNKETFGSEPLDCCKLGRESNKAYKNKSNKSK